MSKMHISYNENRHSSGINNNSGFNRTQGRNMGSSQNARRNEVEGVYKNPRMTFYLSSVLGSLVEIQVKDKRVYEGVFKTFSPNMDVVLELAHEVDAADPWKTPGNDSVCDKLIVKFDDVVRMTAKNADLKYGETESFTDAGISRMNTSTGDGSSRELEPWMADSDTNESLDEVTFTNKSANYRAEDMFKDNERKFGVKSSYDDTLDKYTTKLKVEDTAEYRKRLELADRAAREIETSQTSQCNLELENGDEDEESQYSAVRRPYDQRDARASGDRVNNERHGEKESTRYPPNQQRNKYDISRVNGRNGETPPRTVQRPIPRGGIGKPAANPTASVPSTADLKKFSKDFHLATPTTNDESKGSDTQMRTVSRHPDTHRTPPKPQPLSATLSPLNKQTPASVAPTSPSKQNKAPEMSPAQPQPQNKPPIQAQTALQTAAPPPFALSTAATPPSAPEVKNTGSASTVSEIKSTLNPEAKEFKLNPEAKEFKPNIHQAAGTTPPASSAASQPKKTAIVSVQHGQYVTQQVQAAPRSENIPVQGQPIQQMPVYQHSTMYQVVQPPRTVARMTSHPGPETQPIHVYSQQPMAGFIIPPHGMPPHGYPSTAQTPPSSQAGSGMAVAAVPGQHPTQHGVPPIHNNPTNHLNFQQPHQGANPQMVPYGVTQHHGHAGSQASVPVQQGQPGQVRASPQPTPSPAPAGNQTPYQSVGPPPFYATAPNMAQGLYQQGYSVGLPQAPHPGMQPQQVVYYHPQPGYPQGYPPQQ